MRPATLLVIMLLMFVGGSPSSTAGGIKTTTLAVILAAVNAELRGREPRLLGRTLAAEVLRRATTVVTVSAAIVFLALLCLSLTERQDLLALAFEVVSAFGTVGLSTGITSSLSTAGKLIVILTMFAGRVGPLTVALAVSGSSAPEVQRPAREDLPVG
jgi:trk system potassium uptake protein TrkH